VIYRLVFGNHWVGCGILENKDSIKGFKTASGITQYTLVKSALLLKMSILQIRLNTNG
jgi:hypothetical protein